VNRSQQQGLLARTADAGDRRLAVLQLTRKGKQVMGRLAGDHARELNEMAPRLTRALEHLGMHAHHGVGAEAQ
jgi:DNA-binding MarR family transcriptional regulator